MSEKSDRATRRAFLQYAGIALGTGLLPESSGCSAEAPFEAVGLEDGALTIDTSLSVVRSADLLALRFDFVNLACADGKTFTKVRPAEKSFVVVTFPPQHVVEAPVPASGIEPALSVDARVSGPSRLVFQAEGGGLAN